MGYRMLCERCRGPIHYDHPGEVECGACGWGYVEREAGHLRRECQRVGLDYRAIYRDCGEDLEQIEQLLHDWGPMEPLGYLPVRAERPHLVCRYGSVPTRPGPDELATGVTRSLDTPPGSGPEGSSDTSSPVSAGGGSATLPLPPACRTPHEAAQPVPGERTGRRAGKNTGPPGGPLYGPSEGLPIDPIATAPSITSPTGSWSTISLPRARCPTAVSNPGNGLR
jgi:hypothetical protein